MSQSIRRRGRQAPCLVIIFVALAALWQSAAATWWQEDWAYRKAIIVEPELRAAAARVAGQNARLLLPIRLHLGNFPYFFDLQQDGSDLRLVASDDQSPLDFHIELFDPALGLAVVWVALPTADLVAADGQTPDIYMYYGNPTAPPAPTSGASFGPEALLTMHFARDQALPQDATEFAHHADQFNGLPGGPGVTADGIVFSPDAILQIPQAPGLDFNATSGANIKFWLKLDAESAATARILDYGTERKAVSLYLTGTRLTLSLKDQNPQQVEAARPLTVGSWHLITLNLSASGAQLSIDGSPSAELSMALSNFPAGLTFGLSPDRPGFSGSIDELHLGVGQSTPEYMALQRLVEGTQNNLLKLAQDEAGGSSGTSELEKSLVLLRSLSASIRMEGWLILGILAVFAVLTIHVIIIKSLALKQQGRADQRFLSAFTQQTPLTLAQTREITEMEARTFAHSGAFRIYRIAIDACGRHPSGQLSPSELEFLRNAMDAQLVEETEGLNSQLILLTLAVSGGPFLGLLGTVLGVMVTFATIANSGEVNVNTIAPGVSAALATTVMGLIVAIPALFGYNYLAGRVARRTVAMELFIDRFISKLGLGLAAERAQLSPSEATRSSASTADALEAHASEHASETPPYAPA